MTTVKRIAAEKCRWSYEHVKLTNKGTQITFTSERVFENAESAADAWRKASQTVRQRLRPRATDFNYNSSNRHEIVAGMNDKDQPEFHLWRTVLVVEV